MNKMELAKIQGLVIKYMKMHTTWDEEEYNLGNSKSMLNDYIKFAKFILEARKR